MTELIYLDDSYTKEFTAKVIKVDGDKVYLDRTAFYPQGGGQPTDTGMLECKGEGYKVTKVKKDETGIAHYVDKEGLNEGDEVLGKIDWERRYKIMRMHTAAHAISSALGKKFDVQITGNNLDVDKSRIDFNLDEFDRDAIEKEISKLNEAVSKGAEVSISYMPREDALKDPELVKLANVLPPAIKELRIVEIKGIDRQCDGGTHVKDAKEIGTIEIVGMENKGKNNRRIYFTVK
ncbi:alanyl-tRNA editing protein [Candidatus Woesearchaeota archaeon]|nr:alanyl-tRNA editing protein [Candidatus Woesearchaeota archaeon]